MGMGEWGRPVRGHGAGGFDGHEQRSQALSLRRRVHPTAIMHQSLVKTLHGLDTEVAIQTYEDRVLVLVTQYGKVGNLVRCCSCILGTNKIPSHMP